MASTLRTYKIADIPPVEEVTPGAKGASVTPRIDWATQFWSRQDQALRLRDRQIEENIRMLAGQQWIVFHPLFGKYIDITHWMTDEERRWRQRPVFNRLLPWFILTHARMTENQPVVTFVPGPDRIDSELAEVMDTVYKTLWREIGMTDVVDRLFSWLIPAGEAYLQSRVDMTRGQVVQFVGQANLPLIGLDGQPLLNPNTGEPITQTFEDVPFDEQGEPRAEFTEAEGYKATGSPHTTREGMLDCDVLSPLEVRGEWGPTPWHRKRWHMTRSYVTAELIWDMFKVEIDPTTEGERLDTDTGELERVLFGSGYFGAASAMTGSEWTTGQNLQSLVPVYSLWHAPAEYAGMQETADSPGGRLLIFTRTRVLRDGPRPARFPYVSPIRQFQFVRLPGRPAGSSPQEAMNGLQRSYNTGWKQIQEHRNLVTNPKAIIDPASGIKPGQVTNRPGEQIVANRRAGIPPFEFVQPPRLGDDVYRTQALLLRELIDYGSLAGTEGDMQTDEASGELVKELRFNSDRFLGPTMRRAAEEFARLTEDWMAILPHVWTTEKLIAYAGEDTVARTVTVMPYMLQQGKVNAVPDVESMLPEGRGNRQARVYRMYLDGLFGLPGSPEAVGRFFDNARFPHLSRTAKPGGVDRTMAEHVNGMLIQGVPAANIPLFPWYDDTIHLFVLDSFMKSPEFLKIDPAIQQEFMVRRQMVEIQQQMKLAQMLAAQANASELLAPPEPAGENGTGRAPRKAPARAPMLGDMSQFVPPTAAQQRQGV
jgi:hypothetical protein